jgi:hypothetical protein
MSTFLLSKSSDNKKAAERLLNVKLYAPSIHCSYCACLLLMLDIMTTEFGQNDAQIEQTAKDSAMGTHNWLIQEFKSKVYLKNPNIMVDFNRDIDTLKSYRKKADYKNIEITPRQSETAVKICLPNITSILAQNFQTSSHYVL